MNTYTQIKLGLLGVILVGLMLIAIAIYSFTRKPEPLASASTSLPSSFTIPANIPWTNTVHVSKGQQISITATGKSVWKNIANNNPNAYPKTYEECGPDGTQPVDSKDYYSNISQYQSRNANKGALIGKIGEYGLPFLIGSNFNKAVEDTGNLYLGINDTRPEVDSTAYADNSGSFNVGIQVTSSNQSVSLNSRKPYLDIEYPSGSGWIKKPQSLQPCPNLSHENPRVTISKDGLSCVVIVPADFAQGVQLTDGSGRQFTLHKEQQFEINATGKVQFSADHPCVSPEGMKGWYDPYVDSPFSQNVGGLEFSIGPLSTNRYLAGTHYIGQAESDGVPNFRIIERSTGYTDNNSGAFIVNIKRINCMDTYTQIKFGLFSLILVGLVLIGLVSYSLFHKNQPIESTVQIVQPEPTKQSTSQEKFNTVTVNPQRRWTHTGITVNKGDKITITATGQVTGSTSPQDAANRMVGPDGWGYSPTFQRQGQTSNDRLVIDNSFMCLIGRIENGSPFYVGSSYANMATTNGELELGVNDSYIFNGKFMPDESQPYFDNGGSFTATIHIPKGK